MLMRSKGSLKAFDGANHVSMHKVDSDPRKTDWEEVQRLRKLKKRTSEADVGAGNEKLGPKVGSKKSGQDVQRSL